MSEQTAADRQIARANELERQRGDLMDLITANRDYLRLMDKNEELSTEQGDWLDVFYPQKEKGEQRSKQEVEATRKVKEAARKGATGITGVDVEPPAEAPPAETPPATPPAPKPAPKTAAK